MPERSLIASFPSSHSSAASYCSSDNIEMNQFSRHPRLGPPSLLPRLSVCLPKRIAAALVLRVFQFFVPRSLVPAASPGPALDGPLSWLPSRLTPLASLGKLSQHSVFLFAAVISLCFNYLFVFVLLHYTGNFIGSGTMSCSLFYSQSH